ncbi:MAG TPA: hypothetical protein VHF89_18965, partial [Solirubrobacteraceae bacterium]|nr:hypothetical protein [Solirubrobacteraceae bacterium]
RCGGRGPGRAAAVGRRRPKRVRAWRRARVRFRVRTGSGRPASGAVIRLAGARAQTGRRGRAVIRKAFAKPGRRRAVVTRPGHRRARVTIRVVRRRQ